MAEFESDVTEADFEETVVKQSANLPVVADFWAAWCTPCQILKPAMEKLAKEFKGKFVLAKINVEENPGLSERFKISGIPSVKMFKGGKVVAEFTGAMPEPAVRQWLEKNIK
ncbi:MAG: thioredoxin [Candidatus Diapherotrites archaeon]|nr:thioredoxin [Candidatus Diapherotrites archaeon]